MPAPDAVRQLVKWFEENIDSYRSSRYNETQLRRDKLVILAQILELYKTSPRTPQDKELVKREIESSDRQIDRLVYELYGLSEEEIKIVEGK